MKSGRLSLRVEASLLRDAQELARKRGKTLTEMVEQYFRNLLTEEHLLQESSRDVEQI